MLGAAVAERLARVQVSTRIWLRASVASYAVLLLILASHSSTGWIARVAPSLFERGDPTGDLVTWRALRAEVVGRGLYPLNGFVAATSWIQAGKAAVGMGPGTPVLCLCADPHHFRYTENDSAFLGADAILVKKVRENDDVSERFAPYFERIGPRRHRPHGGPPSSPPTGRASGARQLGGGHADARPSARARSAIAPNTRRILDQPR